MRSLSLALLIFCISITTQQAPTELPKCESLSQILTLASCIPTINELKDYTQDPKLDKSNTETIRNMTILCDRATKCLAVNQCHESDMLKKKLEESCELLYYLGDQFHCLTGFFEEAYSHNESTCFQKYDFLEKDLSKKRDAFEKGQSCFTDYVKDNCNQTSIDYFSKNYPKFVNDISIKPNDTDGQNSHNLLNIFQCNAIGQQIPIAVQELHNIKLEPNDTRVAKIIKMCKEVQDCISGSSIIPHHAKQKIEHTCNLLEMVNQGSFVACASKLTTEKPDVSDYECLDGLNFYEKSPENSCKKATTKKECVKKIMEDKCGKEAVADYDKIVEHVAKLLECK
ncbi:hypothetical protein B9Z55_020650 [Caenorhabditis nigoni]|uniref:T20D4.11-like domain-containing protein n=1 Tax=Caenorhabditis nigoni TaxID=1611254 RepID=A0A2G5TNP4_9PELO|nr:hypothetical protein B9Z55_020650 [Caenorhabditis nigoni]